MNKMVAAVALAITSAFPAQAQKLSRSFSIVDGGYNCVAFTNPPDYTDADGTWHWCALSPVELVNYKPTGDGRGSVESRINVALWKINWKTGAGRETVDVIGDDDPITRGTYDVARYQLWVTDSPGPWN